ncbi:MAG: TIGR03936 family radical SAM-associated protein [Dehalococcoidia bacterium]
MRLWERVFRRAGVGLAYSEGFSPHPRISLAAPLAVGITSRSELMDIFLNRRMTPGDFVEKVAPQLPEGISIIEIQPVSLEAPSLQSRLRFAEYLVEVESRQDSGEIERMLKSLLSLESLPWHHSRDTGERFYDLRPLLDDLWMEGNMNNLYKIGMRLRCDSTGSGRPEQIIKALGLTESPSSIERTKLVFA